MPEQEYNLKVNERVYDSINSIRGRRAKFEDIPDERVNLNELTALGRMLLGDTKPTGVGRMLLGEDGLG